MYPDELIFPSSSQKTLSTSPRCERDGSVLNAPSFFQNEHDRGNQFSEPSAFKKHHSCTNHKTSEQQSYILSKISTSDYYDISNSSPHQHQHKSRVRFEVGDMTEHISLTHSMFPDSLTTSYLSGPGQGRDLGNLLGWQQKWRTIGYYLDEFGPPVSEDDTFTPLDPVKNAKRIFGDSLSFRDQAIFRLLGIYRTLPSDIEHYLKYKVGGRYGTAIGNYGRKIDGIDSSAGSSWIVRGPYLLTANHCVVDSTQSPFVQFGQFVSERQLMKMGSTIDSETINPKKVGMLSRIYLRDRLLSLGIVPSHSSADIAYEQFEKFSVRTHNQPHTERDISVLETSGLSKPLNLNLWENGIYRSIQERYELTPNTLWGSIPLLPYSKRNDQYLSSGKNIYLLQSNEATVYGDYRQTLLSYDGVINFPWWNQAISGGNLYFENGSSGGATLETETNQAFAVIKGYWYPGLNAHLVPKEVDNLLSNYEKSLYDPSKYPVFPTYVDWNHIIRSSITGTQHKTLLCPRGMVAAGILGSRETQSDENIGNFGFVCIPFGSSESSATRKEYLFDFARIIATGSVDTARGFVDAGKGSSPIEGERLDTYMNEVVLRQNATSVGLKGYQPSATVERIPQAFSNCPPNYYLRGLSILYDNSKHPMLVRIPALFCENAKGSRSLIHFVPDGPGKLGGIAPGIQASVKNISCPSGHFINGLAFVRDHRYPTILWPLCSEAKRAIS